MQIHNNIRQRIIVNDYSRLVRIYCLKPKSEVVESFRTFQKNSKNLLGKDEKVCFVRADQGQENLSGDFLKVMKEEKIDFDLSPVDTPQLNKVVERINLTL